MENYNIKSLLQTLHKPNIAEMDIQKIVGETAEEP